jgi:hypothetical protein
MQTLKGGTIMKCETCNSEVRHGKCVICGRNYISEVARKQREQELSLMHAIRATNDNIAMVTYHKECHECLNEAKKIINP